MASKGSTRPKRCEGDALTSAASKIYDASREVERVMLPFMTQALAPFLKGNPLQRRAYTLKHRVKDTTDIKRKVLRKRKGAPVGSKDWHYEPEHVTDGCGFRIVTLFQRDIIDVVNLLIKMLKQNPSLPGNPIATDNPLKEVTIYTNRPKEEVGSLHVTVKEIFDQAGFKSHTADPENRKSGYSSVHLVVWVPVQVKQDDGTTITKTQAMEIQIRDIFEEGWGEVDYTLRYVEEREDDVGGESQLFDNWKPHLNALKTFLDGCSQHASLIKDNAIDAVRFRQIFAEKLMSDEPEEVIPFLIDVLPEEFHNDIKEAFAAEKRATAGTHLDATEDDFKDAAARFKKLITSTESYRSKETGEGRTVAYRLDMEYAYCLQPKTKHEIAEVIAIYNQVHKEYPEGVMAYYRHGVVERKRGDLDRAIELLSKGVKCIDKDPTIKAKKWVRSALPRNLGYAYWMKSGSLADTSKTLGERLQLLRVAFDMTEQSLKIATEISVGHDEERKSLNNMCWFAMDCLKLRPSGIRRKITRTRLKKLLTELEAQTAGDSARDLYMLHTLMAGFGLLGVNEKARRAAGAAAKLMYSGAVRRAGRPNLRADEVRQYLAPEIHDIHDDVLRLLLPRLDNGVNEKFAGS